MLRVFVSGGGCSGFQYGFTFDEKIQDGDTEVERDGVKLLVDPMSFQYLVGAEIDYIPLQKEEKWKWDLDLLEKRFLIFKALFLKPFSETL